MADILNSINLDGSNSSNSLIFSNELSGGSSSTESFVGEVNGNTSEVKIKNRISSIVKYNLPEFIRSDYEKFVYFLEAYYKFLEQDYHSQEIIQNIQSYADIDKTASSFVYYFLQNYAKDLPLDTLSDKRFLIKRINDLYTSKGSSLSFDILFRVLFNTTVNIEHPYENVLVPSGGTWTQKSALGLKVISGDKTKITGRFLTYVVNNAKFETPILGYRDFASGDIEVSLDTSKLASRYVVGDSVYVYNALNELVFEGRILSTLVNNSVVQPGQGFRLGQIFNVNFASNTGVLVKVTKVSSTGGLEKLKIINYGYGYPDVLTVNLNKDTTSTTLKDAVTSSTRGTTDSVKVEKLITELSNVMLKGNVTLTTSNNRVDGFGGTEFVSNIRPGDYVTILSNVYTVQNVTSNTQFYITTVGLTNSANVKGFASDITTIYFKEDYTTAPNNYTAASFVTNAIDNDYVAELPPTAVPADFASVVFTSGALARYPGSFTTNKGFVSESEIRLEDDLLYQPFAYQTNTEIDISKFYDIVISLIHPAGQRLFNNRSLNNFFDVSANVSELSAKVSSLNFESYSKGKVSDSLSVTLSINKEDSATSSDILTINSSLGTIQDLLNGIDETINTFAKTISDDVEATEFLVDLDYPTKPVFDGVDSPTSNNIFSINTTINDTAGPTDSGIFDFNPYASEGFFSEDYTESIITF